jgi:hypothetical protein
MGENNQKEEMETNSYLNWIDYQESIPADNERILIYCEGKNSTATYTDAERAFVTDEGHRYFLKERPVLLWRKLSENNSSGT